MSNLIGKSIGRYHILEKLGEGGMATVYKAFDTSLERDVAIKVIRRDAFPSSAMERVNKRFEREARALARLSHPNIVKVLDYGEFEDLPYLAMEYINGGTLKNRLGQPIAWQAATQTVLPIASALEYSHKHNIIHRDIKPSNILIDENEQPLLSDFGIAKILEIEETATLTATGIGVGTPEYMAPEQGRGKTDPRSDVYSLGVILYEMITGRKPFVADTPLAVVLMHATDPLPPPTKFVRNLPKAIEQVLLKALAKNPDNRFQDMRLFIKALEKALKTKNVFIEKVKEKTTFPKKQLVAEHPLRTLITVGIVIVAIILTLALVRFPKIFNTMIYSQTNTPALISIENTRPAVGIKQIEDTPTVKPTRTRNPTLTPTPLPDICLQEPVLWPVNKHYYQAICTPGRISWDGANQNAKIKGGYLASIQSSAENNFVYKLIADKIFWWTDDVGNLEGPWLGGSQSNCSLEPKCGWGWSNGGEWIYSNWRSGEPNNMGSNENKLVFFNIGTEVTAPWWNDVGSSQGMRGYIIEWDTNPSNPLLTPSMTPTTISVPTEITDNKGVLMALVPAGEFTMGSNSGPVDVQPAHQVFLDSYLIDKYEVTNALYKICVDAGVCDPLLSTTNFDKRLYEQHPVVDVNWQMANTYCAWRGARLPTEAEWEKAGRGTDGRTFPWGDRIDCSRANHYDGNKFCAGSTTPVGSYESGKSPFGVYDMIGNVSEWVSDWYDENYYADSPLSNPTGPSSGDSRVRRGSSWSFWGDLNQSIFIRFPTPSEYSGHYIGFRCAKDTR